MIITYLAMKCLRYNSLTSGNVDNQATQKSPHNSSISCKLTFRDKFNQKMDIPLSHLLHFYPPGSFNLQKQFVRLKGVITSLNEGLIHFPIICFPSGAILCETSTQSFKNPPCIQCTSIQIRKRSISDRSYSINDF